ncbi:hypothetical protein BDU57DRAFT_98218 [Ampelomyces quisqualis]|uniref:Transmembrane protein n=1 Tax=Ampelomyces quisqualis TaxID=50730 RepID=A0A6A5Q729_AMPQU|nr:hypothetical protein BDU57DRAFT_98218 [Ampelomyces quisqualis]
MDARWRMAKTEARFHVIGSKSPFTPCVSTTIFAYPHFLSLLDLVIYVRSAHTLSFSFFLYARVFFFSCLFGPQVLHVGTRAVWCLREGPRSVEFDSSSAIVNGDEWWVRCFVQGVHVLWATWLTTCLRV